VDGDAFSRVIEFQRGTVALVAGECRAIDEGWLIRTPSLPQVWSGNQVQVTQAVRFSDALALAERHMSDLSYRQLVVEHEPSGARLERAFRHDGWKVERELAMVLARPVDREVDTSAVAEVDPEAGLGLMARWAVEDPDLKLTEEDLRQVVEFTRRAWRARRARCLGILGAGGELLAMTSVFSDGDTAQVEDVYTVPEARSRGYARALVTRAVSLARDGRHELTFITADDNDWPKQLYQRIGFEPAGRTWHFHREVRG
jgi:GNAT superfamily N-acetyltransferase